MQPSEKTAPHSRHPAVKGADLPINFQINSIYRKLAEIAIILPEKSGIPAKILPGVYPLLMLKIRNPQQSDTRTFKALR